MEEFLEFQEANSMELSEKKQKVNKITKTPNEIKIKETKLNKEPISKKTASKKKKSVKKSS